MVCISKDFCFTRGFHRMVSRSKDFCFTRGFHRMVSRSKDFCFTRELNNIGSKSSLSSSTVQERISVSCIWIYIVGMVSTVGQLI
jgi:hypothetical protein